MIKVTIEKVETVIVPSQEWQMLWDNPPEGEYQYGYVKADLPKTQTTLLLQQSVETLDSAAVIKAVNGL